MLPLFDRTLTLAVLEPMGRISGSTTVAGESYNKDANGFETFRLKHILADDRKSLFAPVQAKYLKTIEPTCLAFYRKALVIDVAAWWTTAPEDANSVLLWNALRTRGYFGCRQVGNGTEVCDVVRSEVSERDWRDLLADLAVVVAIKNKMALYYDFALEMTFQILVHEHCAATDGVRRVWLDWFDRFKGK